MTTETILQKCISKTLAGKRLDVALAQLFPDYSRNQLQRWIREGAIKIDHQITQKTRYIVQENQQIKLQVQLPDSPGDIAQPIKLTIVYEDDAIIVINKPVGLVVHPGAGNRDHTLMNALLYHAPSLSAVPRAGIIHRLDKNTSGLLVIAKTIPVHHTLIKQMQQQKIQRHYQALVQGKLISGGTIQLPIARHPRHRTKMAVTATGKKAVTHYRILERFYAHTLLSIQLETGRTHQIRVHLAHQQHPIVGDKTYQTRPHHVPALSTTVQTALHHFDHQALHAHRLTLTHPVTKEMLEWTIPLPEDMQNLIALLRANQKNGAVE